MKRVSADDYERPSPPCRADRADTEGLGPRPWRHRWLAAVALLGLGILATGYWLVRETTAQLLLERAPLLAAALCGVCALTCGNLLLRWLRWHFLTRTLEVRIKIRDSLGLYFATLPAILTPLYLGEMLRGLALQRRHPRSGRAVVWIWLIERSVDASVLLLFWLAARGDGAIAAAGLGGLVFGVCAVRAATGAARPGAEGRATPVWMYAGVLLGTSFVSWSLPIGALYWLTTLLSGESSLATAAGAYAEGTLLGGISGIPLGTGVTGSTAILALSRGGVPAPAAAVSVALVRAGTAWFAAALGLAVLWFWKRSLRDLFLDRTGDRHFDAIAAEYQQQIPDHMRERLIERKIALLRTRLAAAGVPLGARGLDLGCGQGWYASEMAAAGFEMVGLDASEGQIERAHEHARRRGVEVEFHAGVGSDLDFEDESFDFVYAINVVHHITDPADRRRVFGEIVRVLRKGGAFYLHEMNTENPLFRFYLSYVFPVIKRIDEGDEVWVRPSALPPVAGGVWEQERDYFSFLPDILPESLLRKLAPLERWLEGSRLRRLSAHFLAQLTKRDPSESARRKAAT